MKKKRTPKPTQYILNSGQKEMRFRMDGCEDVLEKAIKSNLWFNAKKVDFLINKLATTKAQFWESVEQRWPELRGQLVSCRNDIVTKVADTK